MLRQKLVSYLLMSVGLICFYFLGYEIPRHHTLPLFTAYGILFLIYLWVINKSPDQTISFWIAVAVCFRLCLLFAVPHLSDDFYRFIWDGRLLASGHHPFAALPSEYLNRNIPGIDQTLYNHLNSKEYFTVYPPVAQYIFWMAVKIFPNSILGSAVVIRLFILLAEAGSMVLMKLLLQRFNQSKKNILLYALNPLIILELTGNLHFEAFVIFFLLLSVYFLSNNKTVASAGSMAVAVCTKLVPLIFLPSLIGKLKAKKLFLYLAAVAVGCALLFLPFFDGEVYRSLQSSVGLYFNKFEFNASLYYLVREFGFWMYGYNIIQTVGWKLGVATFLLIILFVWIRSSPSKSKEPISMWPQDWMWMLSIYFLFTTTLHPWYISTLVALSIFTHYRFAMVWSAFIFLTYAGYGLGSFHENLWLTALEYVLVIGYLAKELWERRNTLSFRLKNPAEISI